MSYSVADPSVAPPRRRTFAEEAFVFCALWFMSDGTASLIVGQKSLLASSLSESDPRKMMLTLLFCGVGVLLSIVRGHDFGRILLRSPILAALVGLTLASALWSVDPGVTLRRAIAHLGSVLFFFYLACSFSLPELLVRIRRVLIWGVLVSIALAIAVPGIAVVQGPVNHGAWVGIYGDKIMTGAVCALAILLTLCMPSRLQGGTVAKYVSCAPCFLLLVMSQSRTSWLAVALGVALMLVLGVMRAPAVPRGMKAFITFCLGFAVVISAVVLLNDVLALFGRTATFSGRTKLWHGAITVAQQNHPVWGAGYRSFWTEVGAIHVRSFIQSWTRLPGNGHNGYLDVWLELGYAGLILFAGFFVTTAAKLWGKLFASDGDWTWTALILSISVFLVVNSAYTLALKHSNILWGLCLLSAAYVAGAVRAPQGGRRRFPLRTTFSAAHEAGL